MATDPWEEEAKQFKAAPQAQGTPAATSTPNEDWKVWQQGSATSQPSQGNFLQQAVREHMQSRPYSTDQGILGNIGTAGRNLGAGALSAIAGGGGDWPVPLGSLTHPERPLPVPQKQPSILAPQSGESIGDYLGRTGGEATKLIGNIGTTLALGKGTNSLSEGISNIRDPIREYRSPLIPHNEAVARSAADVLNLSPTEREGAIRTMTSNMPDIKQTLTSAGGKTRPIEFAKAAMQSGKGATDFYQKNFIEPNMDAPAGGSTVGNLYGRVTEINKELDPIYRSRTAREQMTKEASDRFRDLENERDKINSVLYQTLSERSGIPVDDLRSINQRGAGLQDVGGAAQYSQGIRSGGQKIGAGGSPIPMSVPDSVVRLLNAFRGGTEAVKGRQLGRILGQVQDQPSSFPNLEDINSHRTNYALQQQDAAAANRMASAARKPEGLGPTERITPTIENPNPELLQRSARAATREEGIAQNAAEQRAEALVRAQREAELLARARQTQQAARTLRKPQ